MILVLRHALSVNEKHCRPSVAVGFHVPEVDYHDFHVVVLSASIIPKTLQAVKLIPLKRV